MESKTTYPSLSQKELPTPTGLTNSNAVCYMNAVLQAMLSCTAFNEFVKSSDAKDSVVTKAIRNHLKTMSKSLGNEVAPEFAKGSNISTISSIIANYRNNPEFKSGMDRHTPIFVNMDKTQDPKVLAKALFADERFNKSLDPILQQAKKLSKGKIQWEGNGWQDSQEAMIHILEETGADKKEIFRISYDTMFSCPNCRYVTETETSKSARPQDYVYLSDKTFADAYSRVSRQNFTSNDSNAHEQEALNRCIWFSIDKTENSQKHYGFVCPNCKVKPKTISKIRKLAKIQSVLCVFMPNVTAHSRVIPLAPTIEIPGRDNKKLIFRLVSQVEYTGGHYFAMALRSDGRVHCLNDTSVAPGKLGSTHQTVLAFYHLV